MNNKIIKTLSIKPFSFLLLAEIFSQLGINMLNFLLVIVAFSITSSNTAVSGVLLSFTVPQFFLGLLAGIYVDKWDKKKVLFTINIIRAILVLMLVFLHSNLAAIYLLAFLISIASQFFIPAEIPMIPVLVKNELLLSANAIFAILIYASIFVSYALSGPLLLVFGKNVIFIALAVSFAIAAFFVSLIKVQNANKKKEEIMIASFAVNLMTEIKHAFILMAKTKLILRSLFLLTLANIIILVLAAIGPGYAREILKIEIEQFPLYFVTPAIIGMATGAVIIGSFLHGHPKNNLTNVGLALIGFSILFLPYGSKVESREFIQTLNSYLPHVFDINILHIMVVLAFIMGFANAFVFVPSNTILQEETSEQFRGKIYGALNTMVGLFSFLPIIIVGSLADIIGVKGVLTGIGIIILSIAFLFFPRD